jgi:3-phenylpropionate/trans-cinnamate dioxygenase ferredoxin reductase component
MDYKYVIVGGGVAGGTAVEGIRQVDNQGSVLLITQEAYRPYQRPPLSKKYLRNEVGLDKVYLQEADFYDEKNIKVQQGAKVTGLEPKEHTVTLENGSNIQYEKLLLATGGRARRLSIPGNEKENVLTLRTIEDSKQIREHAENIQSPVLVIGGSFIGAEVSASLSQLGLDVTEVFPESRLLEKAVPEEMGKFLHSLYENHGVQLIPNSVCERIDKNGSLLRATLDNGGTLRIGLVIMGVGIQLNTELAHDAGLQTRENDHAIVVDENLQTSDANIYAAGDIAAWPDQTFGERLRVEHWDVARGQGLQAGRNMAGTHKPYTMLPYFFSDLFDLSFEVWGNLSAWEQTVMRGSFESESFALYYFNQDSLTGVLAVDRPDEERESMESLVKSRARYDEVAEELQNEEIDLEKLTDKTKEHAS